MTLHDSLLTVRGKLQQRLENAKNTLVPREPQAAGDRVLRITTLTLAIKDVEKLIELNTKGAL